MILVDIASIDRERGRSWVLAVWIALGVGCGTEASSPYPSPTGGVNTSPGGGSTTPTGATDSTCQSPPTSASDTQVLRVLDSARGHHDLEGTWLNGLQASVLSVDFDSAAGPPLPESTTGCGGTLLIAATLHVKTRDGVLDGRATVLRLKSPNGGTLHITLPDLDASYARPDPSQVFSSFGTNLTPIASSEDATPTLIVMLTDGNLTADLIVDRTRLVGRWNRNTFGVPARGNPPHVVPPELVQECAPAAVYTPLSTNYTPFASGADALASLHGTWIRCRAAGGQPHAGLQIADDGSWRTLVWQDGELVARGGFQREGFVEDPIDTHAHGFNGVGFFQINLRGPGVWMPTHLWGDVLLVAADAPPPGLDEYVSVYARSTREVAAAPNPFASGERAGAAACAIPESSTIDPEVGDLDHVLAGAWTLCSGEMLEGFTGLRFDGAGRVTLLNGDGSELATKPYRTIRPTTMPVLSPRATNLLFPAVNAAGEADDWSIMLSDRPLKVWISVEGPYTLRRTTVFSALPGP
jgi:hypothetical protein